MSDQEPIEESRMEESSMEDETVAQLLGIAGRRPGADDLELGSMKEVLLARWEWVVESRRRRNRARYLQIAAVLALAIGLGIWQLGWLAPAGGPVGEVRFASSYLRVVDGPSGRSLAEGDLVMAGQSLSTGSEGRASIRLDNGVELRLDRGTRLRLRSESEVALDEGRVYVDTTAAPGEADIAVVTRRGTARDLGTRFAVLDVGEAVRILVREGRVEVKVEGARYQAGTGEELMLPADGPPRVVPVNVWGDDWNWVLRSAADFELAGASLGEFLDWLGGETGWTVELQVEDVAEYRAIRLHGSLEGLDVEESLALVLASTGLEGRRRDGVVTIRPRSD